MFETRMLEVQMTIQDIMVVALAVGAFPAVWRGTGASRHGTKGVERARPANDRQALARSGSATAAIVGKLCWFSP